MISHLRIPIIEISKRYWNIWERILMTIRSSQQVLINNVGKYINVLDSPWLLTRDRLHLYQKQ